MTLTPANGRFPQITRREWTAVLLLALLAASFFLLPYLLGHLAAPDDVVFTGLLINVEDGSYLSAIEQGRAGAWTYRNFFTTEAHRPIFIQGFYLGLGHLARWLGATAVAVWHLALWLMDFLLFLLLYPFIAGFVAKPAARWTAYALTLLGGGFDWWSFPLAFERANTLEAVPMDVYVPEAHVFFSALTYPHFIAGILLIMLILWWTLRALTAPMSARRRWALVVSAGAGNLLLGVVYPFLIFLIAAALGLFYVSLVWRARRFLWPELLRLALIFIIPVPLFLYYAWAISAVAVFKLWNAQAVTLTPNPLHLLLAYGPYLLLGGLSLRRWSNWTRELQTAVLLLYFWVVAVAVLLYLPLNPQRRFVEGLQLPLAILAAMGLFEVVLPRLAGTRFVARLAQRPRYSRAGIQRLVVVLLVLFVSLINLYIYTGTAVTLAVIQPYPLFRPRLEVAAMQQLRKEGEPDAVVLSSYWSGSYLPAQSGHVVFVGQRFETVQFETKRALAERFFAAATPDAWRVQFLSEYQIAYVFYGRSERELGEFELGEKSYLELAYENGETAVYRVLLASLQ